MWQTKKEGEIKTTTSVLGNYTNIRKLHHLIARENTLP